MHTKFRAIDFAFKRVKMEDTHQVKLDDDEIEQEIVNPSSGKKKKKNQMHKKTIKVHNQSYDIACHFISFSILSYLFFS